jgi:hypothetical protein
MYSRLLPGDLPAYSVSPISATKSFQHPDSDVYVQLRCWRALFASSRSVARDRLEKCLDDANVSKRVLRDL